MATVRKSYVNKKKEIGRFIFYLFLISLTEKMFISFH
nr:MAG TPA: hypothetical protein [Caudoviricetes sp.]